MHHTVIYCKHVLLPWLLQVYEVFLLIVIMIQLLSKSHWHLINMVTVSHMKVTFLLLSQSLCCLFAMGTVKHMKIMYSLSSWSDCSHNPSAFLTEEAV